MTELPYLPVISGGETETLRSRKLDGIGGPVATVARAPRVSVQGALETAREAGFEALQSIPVRDLLECVATAGSLYEGAGLPASKTPLTDSRTYEHRVARATGLPVGWVRVSAHWLGYGLRHAAEALRAQSPTGGLDVYDDPAYTRERNVGLAFTPRGRVLGAAMPGNDPAVYAWPALALAMKIPIVVRPSDRDPFTAVRLARALLAAGVPDAAVHVLPSDRDVVDIVVQRADHAMCFGDDDTVAPYRENPTVETYGPGDSVAVVARDPTQRELDTLARGVCRSGGRACFNLTRIVATGDCDSETLATDLARRVADAAVGSILDSTTDVPAFSSTERARRIDEGVAASGHDVTAAVRSGPRLVEGDGWSALRPTVVRSEDVVTERPFPFVGVTAIDRDSVLTRLDRAYLGVCIGDAALERALVRTPSVRKVYGGRYPAAVDLRETHETYLASFLYETTTYDPG